MWLFFIIITYMLIDCSANLIAIAKSVGAPLFSALVAFMLFYLTTERDKRKERKKKRVEYKNRANYLAKLALMSKGACNHQHRLLIAYAKETRQLPLISHSLVLTNMTSLERLSKIISDESSFISLIKHRIYEDKAKSITFFTEFVVIIDYLFELYTNVVQVVEKRHTTQNEESNKYASFASNLTNDLVTLLHSLETLDKSPIKQTFSDECDRIQANFNKQNSRDIETHFNFILIPFLKTSYKSIDKTFTQVKELMDLIKIAEEMRRLREQMIENSQSHAKFIEDSCANFQLAMDNLNSHNEVLKAKLN